MVSFCCPLHVTFPSKFESCSCWIHIGVCSIVCKPGSLCDTSMDGYIFNINIFLSHVYYTHVIPWDCWIHMEPMSSYLYLCRQNRGKHLIFILITLFSGNSWYQDSLITINGETVKLCIVKPRSKLYACYFVNHASQSWLIWDLFAGTARLPTSWGI